MLAGEFLRNTSRQFFRLSVCLSGVFSRNLLRKFSAFLQDVRVSIIEKVTELYLLKNLFWGFGGKSAQNGPLNEVLQVF